MRHLLLALGLFALTSPSQAAPASLACAVKDAKGAPVPDAVVFLVPTDGAAIPPPAAAGEIAQADQEFTTYVTVVQAGSRVQFPNQDNVQHHVYSLSKAKKFEFPLYNPGQNESLVFDVSGMVTLGCNIHDWMIAYLLVVPTPWFAKTGADGTATLAAPPGRYRLEVWHPRLTTAITQEIALTAGEVTPRDFTLTLKPDRRIRRGGASKPGGY
jgi:plastocyanin